MVKIPSSRRAVAAIAFVRPTRSLRAVTNSFDTIVIGGGLGGMTAALRMRRERPDARIVVVEADPSPGGAVRTVRSNGFVCELGPFAFTSEELAPLLAALQHPPRIVTATAGLQGAWFDGARQHAIAVDPLPMSFATGGEEVVQACRRELGEALRLGRAVTRVRWEREQFVLTLGGEVETTIEARELVLAIDAAHAAPLLGAFDPMLPEIGQHVGREQRALVFLGGLAKEAPELRGYGMLAADELEGPVQEVIFCTEVFANRALRDRCLVRVELLLSATEARLPEDAALEAIATAELRRWTGTQATFPFCKVHRFASPVIGGAFTECRVRIVDLTRRVPGLSTL